MNEIRERKLYYDSMFFNLIRHKYTRENAEMEIKRLIIKEIKI